MTALHSSWQLVYSGSVVAFCSFVFRELEVVVSAIGLDATRRKEASKLDVPVQWRLKAPGDAGRSSQQQVDVT